MIQGRHGHELYNLQGLTSSHDFTMLPINLSAERNE
jgi:hypothetical protein